MCRIDAAFKNIDLDEKLTPRERFTQALDECSIEGDPRKLLIKHFSENWKNIFKNTDQLENALIKSKEESSDAKQCIVFLPTQDIMFSHTFINHDVNEPVRNTIVLDFLKEIIQTYYSQSSYGAYIAGMNKIFNSYAYFLESLYDRDYCLTQDFFDDKALTSLIPHERTHVIWDVIYAFCPQLGPYFDENENLTVLKFLASPVPPVSTFDHVIKGASEISKGFEILKNWIKFDSQACRVSYSIYEFLYFYNSPIVKIDSIMDKISIDSEDDRNLKKWFENFKQELQKVLLINSNLDNVSSEEAAKWASLIDSSYQSEHQLVYLEYVSSYENKHELYQQLGDSLNRICSKLTPLQISTWIKYSINKNDKNLSRSAEIWWHKGYFELWKKVFFEIYNQLDSEKKLSLLSNYSPYVKCAPELSSEFSSDWEAHFKAIIEEINLSKKLIPDWTITAFSKLDPEKLIPYIDKSIGILRGELSNQNYTGEMLNKLHQQLNELLGKLDSLHPQKAKRHRLLLMRFSLMPFADASISITTTYKKESFHHWYQSLAEISIIHTRHQESKIIGLQAENHLQIENDLLLSFSHELAEFCLSRLCLRKGEKASEGKYESNQVVEQSPIWRQGYLKALIELGFDLGGKAHKTVNFIKKADSDESVREIASECYKVVRRQAKKNPTAQDLKRGLIAAEWWLFLCQRNELNLNVNHQEAIKTRRNLLRYA